MSETVVIQIPKPKLDIIVVRRIEEVEAIGKIEIPEVARDRPDSGTVLSVGPGTFNNGIFCPTSTKTGEVVLFGKHAGQEYRINTLEHPEGEQLIFMREAEILSEISTMTVPAESTSTEATVVTQ